MRLSKKYGLNPSLDLCFFCGEPKGIVLLGANRGKEAGKQAVYSMEPCTECEKLMQMGVMFIQMTNETNETNLTRTGCLLVLKDEAVRRLVKEPLASRILKLRYCFVRCEEWLAVGLPESDEDMQRLKEEEQSNG